MTKPCIVKLFSGESFNARGNPDSMSANPHPYHFTPPKACQGKWSKIVLEADFSVAAGRQFDRTVAIWLGGVVLFFGTTVEPSPHVAPHWHIQRDLTDYAPLFKHAHEGQVILNNWVSPKYTTSTIHANARVLFYPANSQVPAAASADRVYPLSHDRRGEQTPLRTASDTLSHQFTFPRTVERAYLDIFAQSQSNDERWYTCIANAYVAETREFSLEPFEACGGGNFREVEVLIDHQPAGLAPVYPWVYTGGVAPHLWRPTPDIQALNFVPSRIDLTPFAGLLDNGHSHMISVRVIGANHFFNVAANMLVYLNHNGRALKGSVIRNTLAQRSALVKPTVHSTLHRHQNGRGEGKVDTDLSQSYIIAGDVHTTQGVVETTVSYSGRFYNHQTFRHPKSRFYHQHINQLSTVSETARRTQNGRLLSKRILKKRYPLHLDVHKKMSNDSGFTAGVSMSQSYIVKLKVVPGNPHASIYTASLKNILSSQDKALGKSIPKPLNETSFAHHQRGQQRVTFKDSFGSCYRTRLESQNERLTNVFQGGQCPHHLNHLIWRSRPNNPWLMPLPRKNVAVETQH
jgi:hypothetical protein